MTTKLDISRALTIPGWMSEQELLWLAETASKSRFTVEIGTYLGRSARAILDNMPDDGFLVCVDAFQDCEGLQSDKWGSIWAQCQKNLDIPDNRVGFIKNTSEIAASFAENVIPESPAGYLFDFVFIDGDHSYKCVKQDIELWSPKIASGGIISGHDFGVWPGVRQAVVERFGNSFGLCNSIWYVRKD